ncbi:MAG: site-specific integrase [Clostridia bacterium]|nr:site-specific integrase [Clostridia bacterium]
MTPINEITVSDVQQFFNTKSELSQSTNKHIRYLLNSIFESALEDDLVVRNVMTSKRLVIRGGENPRKALTSVQVQNICQQMPELKLQERLLLSLLLYTGMRRGEILALEWKNVDLAGGLIHVVQSADFPDNNNPSLKAPKSKAGFRVIPILPPLKDVLLEAQSQAVGCFLIGDGDAPCTKRAYQWLYDKIKERINLYGATAHVFRHTFITMSSVFLDPKTLQSIAGHSKCDITLNRYAHAQQEQIAKAGEKLTDLYVAS